MRVLGIVGSLRQGSYNRKLLEAAAELAPDGVEINVRDLRAVPMFDADVEAAGRPAAVEELRTQVEQADAVLIATPEYNGSAPGVLVNTLDWLSRPHKASPLRGRAVALMSASPGRGGLGALATTGAILERVGAHLVESAVQVTRAHERVDGDGRLVDTVTGEELLGLLEALRGVAGEIPAGRT